MGLLDGSVKSFSSSSSFWTKDQPQAYPDLERLQSELVPETLTTHLSSHSPRIISHYSHSFQ